MAINTGFGVFSLGKDIAVDMFDAGGNPLRFGNITDFDSKPQFKNLESEGIDGINRFGEIPHSWKLTWGFDRDSPDFERWIAFNETSYYAGGTIQNGTVTETISEPDGSISVYQYQGVAMKPTDTGNWKGTAKVSMKCEATASRKVRLR